MRAALEINSNLAGELELARQVQTSLLPQSVCCLGNWTVAFSYEPAGAVGGDYVDLIPSDSGDFYFALGDVSGKGIAASMLMSHLHATLRALLSLGRSVEQILNTASQTFCHSSLPAQFPTLVVGKADQAGNVELVNAGHTPVLLTDGQRVSTIEAANVPLGLFCATDFRSTRIRVGSGNSLLLYSDGITESADDTGGEYGLASLIEDLRGAQGLRPAEIVQVISSNVARFTGDSMPADDRTILVLGR